MTKLELQVADRPNEMVFEVAKLAVYDLPY